ncbi:cupredoxin domain-containing protein [Companilactobacillus nuruki]|uniref:Copper-binding protein n=1 Tax=Companilactobacillus nuruki TaxID=1993540 RepID=A0A2N7AXM3_9LACO|nr:cupredoxin domain-containing protein [Companilactobacillus nuruki]PMD73833.1 copper-binding protein [Companilactobacillus nuruki]
MTKILVLIIGIAAIGFILWWFFGNHHVASATANVSNGDQKVDIEVNGGYSPEVVTLKKGIPATINFTRKDASSCLDRVVFSDFGINKELPQNEQQSIQIDTSEAGEYQWACGMDMFHGKLIIK